jgi:hypothetical protein
MQVPLPKARGKMASGRELPAAETAMVQPGMTNVTVQVSTMPLTTYIENCNVQFPFKLVYPILRFVNLQLHTYCLLSIEEELLFWNDGIWF